MGEIEVEDDRLILHHSKITEIQLVKRSIRINIMLKLINNQNNT